MATPILIPKLGTAMTEGTLTEWLVSDGSAVNEGDPLYVLETDKVEAEVEAPTSGVVRHMATAGEVYQVGIQIGEIAPS